MAARDADHRRFHGNSHDRLGFLYGAANRADREVKVHDLALPPTFGLGCAERRKFYAALVIHFADQRAGLGAADIKRHNVPFFLRQARSWYSDHSVISKPSVRFLYPSRHRLFHGALLCNFRPVLVSPRLPAKSEIARLTRPSLRPPLPDVVD